MSTIKFDVEYLLHVAQRHGEDSEPDHEVGDLQAFFRAAWRLLTEQQKAAFFNDPEVAETYAGATFDELQDVFPSNPFAESRVITESDVAAVDAAVGADSGAWHGEKKKSVLAEALRQLAGVPAEPAKAPTPAPRRPRP